MIQALREALREPLKEQRAPSFDEEAQALREALREQRARSFDEEAQRVGVSHYTLRRLAKAGLLRTITVGSRRLIPIDEALRLETEGIPRKAR